MEQEIQSTIQALRMFGDKLDADRKRVFALGGTYFATNAEAAAPVGKKVHKRYSTAKVNRAIRAPKGMGNVVATYYPGNLARSIRVLDLKRAKYAVYVGARLQKGSATGQFSGTRADGYYMHMVEQGTKNWGGKPFFYAAWDRSKARIESIMINEFLRTIEKYKKESGL